ncbi:MAG: hydroxymethylpyrimidine/phosphomethylpyrimidine kinase [Gammaproteobacteria bacterium]|nr:hydroxymethylpyrimidine/phosphomethylpyrimidine kinase [Gammaproteobacteria bacterium]
MKNEQALPVVLVFAGNDPTGGAGIQADIETLASMGCHAAPVITAITIQDTQDVQGYFPLDMATIVEQARTVLEDMPIAAVKIGMLGSVDAIEAVATILEDYPGLPVIFDPVLASGGGAELADAEMIEEIVRLLLPKTTILVPNSLEARSLAREADVLDACAHELLDMGCEYVLITGSHEATEKVENIFYGNDRVLDSFSWERLEGSYHGSGCTLASAIAGLMAQGLDPLSAVHEAQEYTWKSLEGGYRIGMGQLLPDRFFWAHVGEDLNAEDEESVDTDHDENSK